MWIKIAEVDWFYGWFVDVFKKQPPQPHVLEKAFYNFIGIVPFKMSEKLL